MRTKIIAAAAAVVLLACSQDAYCYGEEGHSIIAEIAQRRLSPSAIAMVARLLGPNASLASVASWADNEAHGDRPDTYNWHFVDIPLSANDIKDQRDCKTTEKGDCIVKELYRLRRDLRCAVGDDAKRDALRFATHFVGDIHQPLHTVGDKVGANLVPTHGLPDGTNLHMVWDTALIRHTVYDWGAYVDRLENGLLKTPAFMQRRPSDDPADWALQSHALAQLVWNDQLVPKDGTIGETYYKAVLPVLDQQLALGGVRLAQFLNDAYASGDCDTATLSTQAAFNGSESGLHEYENVGEAARQALVYLAKPASGGPSAYELDQAKVGAAAEAYLIKRLGAVSKPAIVLDIDETSIDNSPQLKANGFGYVQWGDCPFDGANVKHGYSCATEAWDASGRARAIQSTLSLFNVAKSKGVAIFFITGRKEWERKATEDNLKSALYVGYTKLIMRPGEKDKDALPAPKDPSFPSPSAASYKAAARAALLMEGYTVILNLGDQPSDLAGGYAEATFLMPNPYYRIP